MELQEIQVLVLDYVYALLNYIQQLPGSAIVVRYVKSSYQHDPVRSAVELILFLFAVRYMLSPKSANKPVNFVQLSEQEIDELVEDWTPEPLVAPAPAADLHEEEKRPVLVGPTGPKSKLANGRTVINFASYNFYNLVSNDELKEKIIKVLRTYGVGPCGPRNFYGTQDIHMRTEADIAAFLGVPACIIYSQAFSTISSVIPAFSKRGDIIVADKGLSYTVRKGIQLSRSAVRWYEHNDMEDLERVLARVTREQAKKPLTRRFIITEALFDGYGDMIDLPKIVELRLKYKFRLILDESSSFGVLGRTGRGITEHQNVDPTQVDMIVGSLSGPLIAGGGFCAGSEEIVHHQRISAAAYCFSAALPAMLSCTASETIHMFETNPSMIERLRDNVFTMRRQLDRRSDWVYCSSVDESPILYLPFKPEVVEARKLSDNDQHSLFQDIVDECLANGILVTRIKPVMDMDPTKGTVDPPPALKVCMTNGLTKKEVEKYGTVIRHAITKVMRQKR